MGSPVDVSRKTFRYVLLGLMLISAAFAGWSWLRPYEWSPDPEARCRIVGCQVVQDHSNYWVNLHLEITEGEHDLQQKIVLLTADGRELEAADTTLRPGSERQISSIWVNFWVETKDLEGPLALRINDGKLTVRSGSGVPKLRSKGSRYFVTHGW